MKNMESDGSVLNEPPEGVIAGENVPRENEVDKEKETKIDNLMVLLKHRGEPYTNMKDSEVRERAVKKLKKAGEL